MSEYPDKANHVIYEGRVYFRGGKPELRHTKQGNAVCEARMRVAKKYGEDWEQAYFTITAWDDAAVKLSKVGHKDEVIVTGRLTVSSPFTTRDGETVPAELAVVVTSLEVVGEPVSVGTDTSDSTDWSDVPF